MSTVPDIVRDRINQLISKRSEEEMKDISHQSYIGHLRSVGGGVPTEAPQAVSF